MRVLLFSNNVHQEGKTLVTVRRGSKWADLDVGQEIGIRAVGFADIRVACILFVHKCRLGDIPEHMLASEHDINCRTLVGLQRELERVYDDSIDLDETVTVVGYVLS